MFLFAKEKVIHLNVSHTEKVFERVLINRVREQVKTDDVQVKFTQGKSIIDAIFIVRQIQEKFKANNKRL